MLTGVIISLRQCCLPPSIKALPRKPDFRHCPISNRAYQSSWVLVFLFDGALGTIQCAIARHLTSLLIEAVRYASLAESLDLRGFPGSSQLGWVYPGQPAS